MTESQQISRLESDNKNKGSVLITGAGGLIGSSLVRLLKSSGYSVVTLTRQTGKADSARGIYKWDPENHTIDRRAFHDVSHIIHLAGAGIADKRWTIKRKREVVDSRVKTARMIYDVVIREEVPVKCYISASATGIYGNTTSKKIYTEEDRAADDFLARVCHLWEESADMFRASGIRSVKIRTGIVLAPDGGFMNKIKPLAKMGIYPWFGNGKQYIPWIHIDDLCAIYHRALIDENMEGPYNAVAPEHITQSDFMRTYAAIKRIPALKAGIPSLLVRLLLGEMSSMLLKGSRVSTAALEASGFIFHYPSAKDALEQLV
jgi:uncharacterized protein